MPTFGNDRAKLYNVDPWRALGFGAPAFTSGQHPSQDNYGTVNLPIWHLAYETSKHLLYMATANSDLSSWKPPTRNTLERMCKLVTRVQTILGGRQTAENRLFTEPLHASPTFLVWKIHPCPYFPSEWVRNPWMREYIGYVFVALSNIYQHSDNRHGMTITEAFARDIWQYFREIQKLIGMELLQLSRTVVEAEDFAFTPEMYEAYNPSAVITNLEGADTPGRLGSMMTEDSLRTLYDGIDATAIVANLADYPVLPSFITDPVLTGPMTNVSSAQPIPAAAGASAGASAGATTSVIAPPLT